jgi:hypothetical protein
MSFPVVSKFPKIIGPTLLFVFILSVCVIISTAAVPYDFDGDAQSDFIVIRQSGWNTPFTWYIDQSRDGFKAQVWGRQYGIDSPRSNDWPMCDDYDGDGKFDIAVMKWNQKKPFIYYVLNSTDGSLTAFPWGRNFDKPVPQDYDGDGKTDFAIFRGSDGNWYILRSSDNSVQIEHFTFYWDNDSPLQGGDYDGDHKADLAMALLENPVRLVVKYSGSGQVVEYTYGHPWYTGIVSGDFDGDGKTDAAFFDRYHLWRWVRSSDGQVDGVGFGQWNDVPVVGDYDGDGKSDPAVFRQFNTNEQGRYYFFVLRSRDGFLAKQWGNGWLGDMPIHDRRVRTAQGPQARTAENNARDTIEVLR